MKLKKSSLSQLHLPLCGPILCKDELCPCSSAQSAARRPPPMPRPVSATAGAGPASAATTNERARLPDPKRNVHGRSSSWASPGAAARSRGQEAHPVSVLQGAVAQSRGHGRKGKRGHRGAGSLGRQGCRGHVRRGVGCRGAREHGRRGRVRHSRWGVREHGRQGRRSQLATR